MAIIPSEQKFHTLDKDTPTKDRGSKQAQALRKIYTMSDISSTAAGSIGVPTDIQYDTVAVMQAATPDVGKYATTLGYTTPGDGGGALYIIAAADPGGTNHTIALANGTFAVSQFSELFVPQQWGVVSGDNSASAASANVAGLNAMFAHMQDVANSGADLIMLEMMSDLELTLITLDAAQSSGLPVWVGLSCKKTDNGEICLLMSDVLLADALVVLEEKNIPLLNIMHTEVDIISDCLEIVDKYWSNYVGVYAHSGIYKNPEWIFDGVISPEKYSKESEKWLDKNINIIGGCCGIGVEHISCINSMLKSK